MRLAIGSDLAHARVALETLDGVRSVRISPSTRSIAFDYDGRSSTREAVLERINEERLLCDALMARALRLASSSFEDLPEERVLYVDGTASLLADAGHGVREGTG